FTFKDIVEELRKPGRDPRDKFVAPSFRDDVKSISDLQPGMTLEGVVTNVTNFGAFVDVGVHQDGLVHISELSNRYVKDPAEVVKVGQIVKAQVLSADPKTKRIALSMKALMGPAPQQGGGQQRRPDRAPQPPQPTLEDKLAALSNRWKTR
ncbi:MAG: S1 RNA-binding domain-containing protein, partial [Bryobacterales bacterium]|nr:S1 RNA-binding domain-containing protein [Bryobacterales bacterium]